MSEKLKIYFLGTGGSTPFSGRRYPCIALRYLNKLILFDVGEGCQFALVEHKIHPLRYDTYILLTHFHADHTSGLVGLLHTYNLMEMKHKVILVGPSGLRNFTKHLMSAFLIYDFYFPIQFKEVNFVKADQVFINVVEEKEFLIKAFPTLHSTTSIGYIFEEHPYYKLDPIKLEELGVPPTLRGRLAKGETVRFFDREVSPEDVASEFRVGRKIVYSGDTKPSENTINASFNADLLIHEATFIDKELAMERYHTALEDAIELAKRAHVKRLALIHISARYDLEEIKERIRQLNDSGIDIIVPNDGDSLLL